MVAEVLNLRPGAFWFWTSMLAILALVMLYFTFRNLHRARLVEDTPTSRIRSAPQGYVELIGEAAMMPGDPVIAPLSGNHCCWWSFRIERKGDKGWRVQRMGKSDSLFLIRDETGECIIDPDRAQLTPSEKQIWYGPNPGTGPDTGPRQRNLSLFGLDISLRRDALGGEYRYTEETIMPGDPLYAIGLFTSLGEVDRQAMRDEMIRERLRQWKADHASLLKRFDRNRDGRIDLDEWEGARHAATREVTREQLQEPQQPIHTLSHSGSQRRPLLISTQEEFDIVHRLRLYSLFALAGFFVLGSMAVWMVTVRLI